MADYTELLARLDGPLPIHRNPRRIEHAGRTFLDYSETPDLHEIKSLFTKCAAAIRALIAERDELLAKAMARSNWNCELEGCAISDAEAVSARGLEWSRKYHEFKRQVENAQAERDAAVLPEREACAKVCDTKEQLCQRTEDTFRTYNTEAEACHGCAAAIRARSDG